jgi:hypothetical protein
MIMEDTADQYFLNIGDLFYNGPLEIQIVGIWKPVREDASYWYDTPRTSYANTFWVPEAVFDQVLSKYLERPIFYLSWYVIVDETKLQFNNAIQYAQGLIRINGELNRMIPGLTIDNSPMEALQAYMDRAQRLTNLFYAIGGQWLSWLLFIGLTATIAIHSMNGNRYHARPGHQLVADCIPEPHRKPGAAGYSHSHFATYRLAGG